MQDLAKKRAERIAYLEKRRAEIYDIMAIEKEVHAEWRAKVKAKFEECEDMKKALLASMKRRDRMGVAKEAEADTTREECMEAITGEFILVLMGVDFEHEIEDVYDAGKKIFRSFDESERWAGSYDI
jgi:hypothetical protein